MKRQVWLTAATSYKFLDLRAELAIESVWAARTQGWQFIAGDCSSPQVRTLLKEAGAVIVESRQGLGPQKRAAIWEAMRSLQSGDDIIITMEPERASLIPLLKPFIEESFNVEILVIGRLTKSMETYPFFQQFAENYGNEVFRLLTGRAFDVWFGPRAFTARNSDLFLNYNPASCGGSDMWDSFFVPLIDAIAQCRTISQVLLPFKYPPAQLEQEKEDIEMCLKRLEQLNNIVPALKARKDYYLKKK